MLGLNVRAAFFVAQAVARRMIDGRPRGLDHPHVLADGPCRRRADRTLYCASKWAIEGLTKAMAIDLGAARHPRQHPLRRPSSRRR